MTPVSVFCPPPPPPPISCPLHNRNMCLLHSNPHPTPISPQHCTEHKPPFPISCSTCRLHWPSHFTCHHHHNPLHGLERPQTTRQTRKRLSGRVREWRVCVCVCGGGGGNNRRTRRGPGDGSRRQVRGPLYVLCLLKAISLGTDCRVRRSRP